MTGIFDDLVKLDSEVQDNPVNHDTPPEEKEENKKEVEDKRETPEEKVVNAANFYSKDFYDAYNRK